MGKLIAILLGLLLAIIIGIAIGLIPATLFYFAWREIAVPLFHAPALTFFQCWLVTAVVSVISGFIRSGK
jgi:uncharacterized protein YneF (UPF0154 family)